MFRWTTFRIYPEVQICTEPFKAYQQIKIIRPTHIHIGTEGPIGLAARIYCKLYKIPYTTGYHTKFPDYLWKLAKIPTPLTYAYLKIFHNDSKAILTPSMSCKKELENKGFSRVHVWMRGVSEELISQRKIIQKTQCKIKVLYVGRVSREKNLEALCHLQNIYDITVVGEGPCLKSLKRKYTKVRFVGYRFGRELADTYRSHHVFCFPSKTDTFGIVMIEALVNGLPVAAFEVTGPRDIVEHNHTGFLGEDLERNIKACLKLDREVIKARVKDRWSWNACVAILYKHLLK